MGMKAVIMAGGEGTRLRPLTRSRPKPLMPVGRWRCIDYSLASLARAGISEVIVTTSYKADMIVDGLEASEVPGRTTLFSFERVALGTAGGVRRVMPFLDDTFLVLSADVLADVDLSEMVAFHRRAGAVATMALTEVERVSEYGVVALDGEGRIQRFQEKPVPEEAFSNLVNAGIYVLEPEAMELVPEDAKFDFSKDLFPRLLGAGQPMYGHRLSGLWMDIGRPLDLIIANQRVIEREGPGPAAAPTGVSGPVQMGEGVSLGPGAQVTGPSMVADGVVVGEGSRVVRSVLHPGVVVEAGTVVEDSLVLANCTIGSHCQLTGSILDAGSVVGQGARLVRTVVGAGVTVGPTSVHEDAVLGDG
jgi:mannose-1-phosphate guanylyltransferase